MLIGGGLVILLYLCLIAIAVPSRDGLQIVLPRGTGLLGLTGGVLLALAQLCASAVRKGWRRLLPLLALMPMGLLLLVILGLAETQLVRYELDRLTLRDGRVVMMTIEPGTTDTIFALLLKDGWRWRPLFTGGTEVSYSEDGSFTEKPALVLTPGERHILIRRGGIWTDCWRVGGTLQPCLRDSAYVPDTHSAWLDRSDRITAYVGMEPPRQ